MLVGVMCGDSMHEYHLMTSGSPVQMIEPAPMWLSTPTEGLSMSLKDEIRQADIRNSDFGPTVEMRPVMFRHLLNPDNRLPGLYAALLPADGSTALELRRKLGVKVEDESFIPNMLIVHDGMRSQSSRNFFRTFSEMCAKRTFTFLLFEAQSYKEEHAPMFENYNPEAQQELKPYLMFSQPSQAPLTDI